MCGRYAVFGPVSIPRDAVPILNEMNLELDRLLNTRPADFNAAPTDLLPVIAQGQEGSFECKDVRWGLVPHWAKDMKIGARMINARAETVQEKPAFRTAFKKRRCLVPACGYFEWKGEPKHKQPYFIHAPGNDLMMFAGLWEVWKPGDEADWLRTFTIVTGPPGLVSGDIHDRMPVILPPTDWLDWLTEGPDVAADILLKVTEPALEYHPVTKAVGSVRNDGPELVEPIAL